MDPTGFLCDSEGGIGGIDCHKCTVAQVWGGWAFARAFTCGRIGGDTVDEDFGPFDIGPLLRL